MKLLPHQQRLFDKTKDRPGYALLWEMRVGKTYPTIKTAEHLFLDGKIDAVLVIAPNGVHLNWSRYAIPECRPDDTVVEWTAAKGGTKKFEREVENALDQKTNALPWFCVNVEGLQRRKSGRKYIPSKSLALCERLVQDRRVLLIVDESHAVKNPKAQRTRAVMSLAADCPFRRLLTGTPATQGPFDLWSQFYLISPSILGRTFVPFKQRYGVFVRQQYGDGPAFDQLVDYKNLDELYEKIEPYSSRLTQKDVLDLPDLVYERRLFELSERQRKAYDQLKKELVLQLDSGELITAREAIVCLLRLQQISRGYIGDGSDGKTYPIEGPRPALDALESVVSQLEGKFVIWCRFTHDVADVVERLGNVVRYDGTVPVDDRPARLEAFRSDECRGLVGTPATGGTGIDLSAADTTIFYSHGFNLGERLQALARVQGMNQTAKSLLHVDLVAADTVDARCLQVLGKKQDLAATLTGDALKQLIE